MPPRGAKGKQASASGLGRAIINKRAKESAKEYEQRLHTTELPSGLSSVTQENDLDEFLNTAQLAGTEFTAERQNVVVLAPPPSASDNPYLLSPGEEESLKAKHKENRSFLRVPRRPPWDREMGRDVLERRERDSFLEWRRGLAELTDAKALLLTPFERNLSVWRQLWRTLERSHLVVQIVDARNPLRFRCEDLETYVKEVDAAGDLQSDGVTEEATRKKKKNRAVRKNLLLINKSDLLTEKQRRQWAAYFDSQNISYAFFSAADAVAAQEAKLREEGQISWREMEEGSDDSEEEEEESEEDEDEDDGQLKPGDVEEVIEVDDLRKGVEGLDTAQEPDGTLDEDEEAWEDDEEGFEDEAGGEGEAVGSSSKVDVNPLIHRAPIERSPEDRTRVLSVDELEELFMREAPDLRDFAIDGVVPTKLVVGLVGYPNVGKSSTINALLGAKKVSVSATPGKTKHFQTLPLSPSVTLCDCPGLVFPQFASTKAELVCDGVLPIDQMREYTGPVGLVTRRVPKEVLEAIYGLRISTLPEEEGGDGVPTALELLATYAIARGFFTQGQGNPDGSRASRYILKDFVNAKLLYCHPPPGIEADDFNQENRDLERLRLLDKIRKKQAPLTRVGKDADTFVAAAVVNGQPNGQLTADGQPVPRPTGHSHKSLAVDRSFFATTSAAALSARPSTKGVDGGEFSRTKFGTGVVGDGTPGSGKKHFKMKKREKKRSGKGYD